MRDHLDEHELADEIEVVVVTFTSRELAEAHSAYFGLSYPVLLDPTMATYVAFGLERASAARVWGWRAGWRYLRLFFSGLRRLPSAADGRYTEDTRQLGGDFVLRDGLIHWGYWSEGSDDRPDPTTVVAECID